MKTCIHCMKMAQQRGCCLPCYRKLYRRVMAGLTTLEELERQGWLKPALRQTCELPPRKKR